MNLRVPLRAATGFALAAIALGATAAAWSSSATAAGSPVTYTIGNLTPLTGDLGIYGVPEKDGAALAVSYVNKHHLLGKNVTLAVTNADDQSAPQSAISEFQNLASSKAVGIICCDVGTIGVPVKPVAIQSKVPTVMDGAASPHLTQLPYVYRTIFDPSQPGSLYDETADAAKKFWHVKTAVVVYSSDSQSYAGPVLNGWVNELAKDHIKMLAKPIASLTTDTNFSQEATQIQHLKPDLVVADTLSNATANLIRSLHQFGYKGHIVSSYGVDSKAVFNIGGGPSMAGVMWAATYSPLSKWPESVLFTKLFKKADHSTPTLYTAEGWNSIMFFVQGIKMAEKSGSVTRQSLAQAMTKIKSFDSTNGEYTIKGGDSYFNGKPLFVQWNKNGTQSVVGR